MDPLDNNNGGTHSDSKSESDSKDLALADSDFIHTTLVHNNGDDEDGMLWEINLQSEELLNNADNACMATDALE